MDRDVVHKYWLDDRHAQVLFDRELKMFIVEMYLKTEFGMKKVLSKPIENLNEQLAEDTAEDWVHGDTLLPKEYANDN
tara:strand:- start:2114 stop:2347 length:234 start_codon:yes stop_codon:yes gene_type:complete